MERGTIKTIKLAGFGFITPTGRGDDIFFHATSLQGGLAFDDQLRGQRVEFETELDRRSGKLRASGVWPASN